MTTIIQSAGNRTELGYIAETTAGTTPATPVLQQVAVINNQLEYSRDKIDDNSIRGDRQKYFSRLGNINVGGKVTTSFAPQACDDWLASAFGSAWATNVLKVGSTLSTFTLETAHLDTGLYDQYTGMTVSSFELDIQQGNKVIQADWTFVGMGGTKTTTSLSGSAYTATVNDGPFVHLDGVFTLNGQPVGFMTGIKLKGDNKTAVNHSLGTASARGVNLLQFDLSGTVTGYLEDLSQYTAFTAETLQPLQFVLTTSGHSQTWLIPKAKWLSFSAPVSGDGVIPLSISFEGLHDSSTGTVAQITRT